MKRYRGKKDGDEIEGGGNFVGQNSYGHEIFNFEPSDGKMYGFVEPKTTSARHGRNSLHIEKIDESYSGKDIINNVLVIWTALQPDSKGTYIVGWYKNATVYRNEQTNIPRLYKGENFGYFVTADADDCTLLPENLRKKEVYRATARGKGWIGQSNIWYANHPDVANFKKEIVDYIKKY